MSDSTEKRSTSIDEGQMKAILDTASNAVILIDHTGAIRYCNAHAGKIFGYSCDELLGLSMDLLLPDNLQAGHPAQRQSFFRDPSARAMEARRDLRARHKNGSTFPVEIGLNPLQTPTGLMAVASVIDISGRVLHEQKDRVHAERVALLNQKFEGVLAASPYGVLTTNEEGVILFANRVAATLFGYTLEELTGLNVDQLLPDGMQAGHQAMRDAFIRNPSMRAMGENRDLVARRKDGVEIQVEVGLNTMQTEDGVEVLASILDITQRVQAVKRQERLNQELMSSNDALEESNLELQQFAYVASHDLQSPLRSMASFAKFLQEDYYDTLDEEGKQYTQRIMDGATRMKALIDDLLTYSRVESRSMPFTPVDMELVLDEVLDMLTISIADLDAEITRDPLPSILGDRGQLTHLVQNLISNGIKYHGDKPPKVHVSSKLLNGAQTLSVKDNGIGIDKEHHGKIFEIFKRLHGQQEYPGTGIGLAVCKRIVKRHNGAIRVESAEGQGTCIFVDFPPDATSTTA